MTNRDVYIVDGSRTPYLKARGGPGPFSAADLGVQAARNLILRQPFAPTDFDEVITGCVLPNADEANVSRVIALRLGCGQSTPAWTVQRNCASGMQALDTARINIAMGRSDLVLAGGVDAMSHAPLLYPPGMASWLGHLMMAKTPLHKLGQLVKFKPYYLKPIIALLVGLTDPIVGLSMGQTAEILAKRFNITRKQMDEFALQSHQRAAAGYESGAFAEVSPIFYGDNVIEQDDGIRADSDINKLAKLKPYFDKKYGLVTAGNSSQVTDGACYVILASEDAVKRHNLTVRGKLIDCHWAALDPAQMGYGPIHAATKLMQAQKLAMNDIDFWEINEAFAAQVLACVAAWQDPEYCKTELDLPQPMGAIPMDRLNVDGGAIAVGHPIGSSGARISLHLLSVLERQQAKRGIASICIGGGQGGALLIETP